MSEKIMIRVAIAVLFGVTTACSSIPVIGQSRNTDARAAAPIAMAVPDTSEGVAPGRLPASNLPPGECGMILWTLDERSPAAIFRYLSGKSGEVMINGTLIPLARTAMSGATSFGVHENQVFSAAEGALIVKVDVKFALGFEGGVYLERGVVAIESGDGWRTVSPSAGLAGCRAKS